VTMIPPGYIGCHPGEFVPQNQQKVYFIYG